MNTEILQDYIGIASAPISKLHMLFCIPPASFYYNKLFYVKFIFIMWVQTCGYHGSNVRQLWESVLDFYNAEWGSLISAVVL